MGAYENWKPVRNYYRKFSRQNLILRCARKLHSMHDLPSDEFVEKARQLPHFFLLKLEEWIIKDEHTSRRGRKDLTDRNWRRLINKIHDYHETIAPPELDGIEDVTILTRRHSYQQFAFQRPPRAPEIGRTVQLFIESERSDRFNELFKNISRLTIRSFLSQALAVVGRLHRVNQPQFLDGLIDELQENCGHRAEQFRDFITRDWDEYREYLDEISARVRNHEWDFFDTRRLRRFPFLWVSEIDSTVCLSPHLAENLLDEFLFDTLKDRFGNTFLTPFSSTFEEYVGDLLATRSWRLCEESDLSQPEEGEKLVDYLVEGNDKVCLIDAKAVELSAISGVGPMHQFIDGDLFDSVGKAFVQIYSVAQRLLTGEAEIVSRPPASGEDIYGLIVTYKPVHVGTADDFVRDRTRRRLKEMLEKRGLELELIPLDQILVISARELELLTGSLPDGEAKKFFPFLETVIEKNADPSQRKHNLQLHLQDVFNELRVPDFLNSRGSEFMDEAIESMRPAP